MTGRDEMATIELQDVTRVFDKAAPSAGTGFRRRTPGFGEPADRAFAERVSAQAETAGTGRDAVGGNILALDHVDLTIPDGQTLAIVGPSGCGKSTLLRVVAGLDTDYQGRVLYDGEDVGGVPVAERYIGMVFQNYALYPHFKGQGNLSFFFRVRKINDAEAEKRIRITSELMGIGFDALLERKPGALSGGQQQRVAIARALVRNPRLFLFDEPLSNLDAKLRVQTRVEIKRLLHRFQITSLYVTHDQLEAIALGDSIAVMRAGRVDQVGTYQELRDHPATAFVAGFLGTPPMNLLPGGVIADGALHLGDLSFVLPEPIRSVAQRGQTITVGIRPEAIQLIASTSSSEQQSPIPGVRVRGIVDMVEPDFARQAQMVYVRSDGLSFGVITSLDAAIAGATVEVVFPPDQLYLFDAASDRRI